MDANQFIAALSDKIDRREKLEEIIEAVYAQVYGASYRRDFVVGNRHGQYWRVGKVWAAARALFKDPPPAPSPALQEFHVHEQAWWAVREYLRCIFGVYEMPSDVLRKVDLLPWWAGVHQSKDDPTLVAYTPDAATGQRDARVKIALGRLLRKFNPTMPDSELAELEATYRSDLSDEIEFITDEEALVEAYLQGPSSCMAHPSTYFDLPEDLHPVQVYADAPGVALAVLRDAEGQVNARALTYVNPSDPNDKRYLRVYGDATRLERRLRRRGFVCKSFVGVRLRAIPVPGKESSLGNFFLVPYLDGAGSPNTGDGFMLTRDSQFLEVVTAAERQRLQESFPFSSVSGNLTSGTARLRPGPADTAICPLTGVEYNPRRQPLRYAVRPDGEVVQAAALPESYNRSYLAAVEGRLQRVNGPDGVPVFTAPNLSNPLVDNEATRRSQGFVRLDPELYPDGPVWALLSKTLEVEHDGRARRVMQGDCILMCEKDAAGNWHRRPRYKTCPPPAGAIWVYRVNNMRTFVPAGTETVKLDNGQKAVPGLHGITQLWDGRWALVHRVGSRTIGGVRVAFKKGSAYNAMEIIRSEWWREHARGRILSAARHRWEALPVSMGADARLDRACSLALLVVMGLTWVKSGEHVKVCTSSYAREFTAPFKSHLAGWRQIAEQASAQDVEAAAGLYLAETLAQWLKEETQRISLERAVCEAQTEAYAIAV